MQSTADRVLQAMQPYKIKEVKKNQYSSNSPLRAGSNSMAFSLLIEDGEHGTWHDHVSGDSGSLYDLAGVLGVPVGDGRAPVTDSKRSYTGLDDYAAAHGVTGDVLRNAKWLETIKDSRRAIQFPTKSGTRWRFIDGEKPAYKSQQGYQRCWYGLNETSLALVKAGQPLVLCNGEISTVVGQHYDLAAACVTSGENELTPELLNELRAFFFGLPQLKILIAMDCDSKGRHVARGLQAQLRNAGLDATAIDLGLGHKGDLADFCSLHKEEALSALARMPDLPVEAPPTIHTRYQFYSLEEVLKLPPVKWLIPGVVPSRGLTVVYGHSGAGKSFYAMDLALGLALDQPVVYVVAEGEGGTPARVGAWMKHNKKVPRKVTFCLGAVNLFYDDDLQYFRDQATQYKPVLMVIDTLAMCSSGADENNTKDMQRIVDSCKMLADTLDSAIMLVHHTNKQNQIRGSMTIYNSADSAIQLTKLADEIEVKQRKSKDAREFPTRYLEALTIPLGYTNHDGEEVTSLVLVDSQQVVHESDDLLTENQVSVIDAIRVDPMASLADLALMSDLSRSAVAGVIHRLTKRGLLTLDGQTRLLTPDGERAYRMATDSGVLRDSRGKPVAAQTLKTGATTESAESTNQYAQNSLFGPNRRANQYDMRN